MRLLTLLVLFLSLPARAADDVASWRPWLEGPLAAPKTAAPAFPSDRELARLRDAGIWGGQWTGQPPSVAWNEVVAGLVVKYQQNPLRAARAYAYVHVVIHDALVECARRGCDPAVRAVAMHSAAGRMLDFLYPDETRGQLEALGLTAATAVLASTGGHPQAMVAWQAGCTVAETAIRRALGDGWDLPRLPAKRPAPGPAVWRAAPPLRIYDPIEPHAGQWKTWALKNGGEIEPPAPPEFGTPAYWTEVDEVYAVWKKLTPGQKRIAEDWNLDAGSVTPPGVWNQHAKRLTLDRKLDAAQAARVFSTVNAAMMDAFIACWHAKYKWWTVRPVNIIQETRDQNFLPHIVTPGFPSYVSGHATVSGAAWTALAAFFPDNADKLKAMAEEAALSRLYGGIHFRSDNEQGLALGSRVAARAVAYNNELASQSAATAR